MKDVHISLQNVSKGFSSMKGATILAIEDISFDIRRNEFLSIVGPSGSGKSTLLNMIAGLTFPSSGKIMVSGKDVTGPLPNMGLALQFPTLFEWRKVIDNILLYPELKGEKERYRARAQELIKAVGLSGFEDKHPFELSGGMQFRVSLARAFIGEPDVLLLDEPFSALDALTREKMGYELLNVWEKHQATTVFITHDIEESVFLSDRVVVFSDRPSRVKEMVDVNFPRPRRREVKKEPQFVDLVDHIKDELHV